MGPREALAGALVGGTLSLPGILVGDPVAAAIPPRVLVAYLAAASEAPCKVDWRDLAGIGKVETDHGRFGGTTIGADGKASKRVTSWAGAMGPMQFMPGTWEQYKADGDGDGQYDPDDIDDAAKASAALLCASDYTGDRVNAIGAYNGGSRWRNYTESIVYVHEVDTYAASLPKVDAKEPGAVSTNVGGGVRDRTLGNFAERTWQRMVVRPWLWLGNRLPNRQAWERADFALFGGGVPTEERQATAWAATWAGPGLQPEFQRRLDEMFKAAPGAISVYSGWRSPEVQADLWRDALRRYGSADAARQWVAPAEDGGCSSNHCRGVAADLAYGDDAVQRWAHDNAWRFDLQFRMDHEPWHVEPTGL